MKIFVTNVAAALLLIAAPAMAADAMAPGNAGATPLKGDATFKAFHGKEGIQRIMDDFVPRIAADPRISERFVGANLPKLNLLLVEQVCYLVGGPCEYGGKDMKSAHAAMGLQNADFNALAEDLQISMNKEKVSFPAQERLIAKLAPMQRAIVTR